nr:pilus assembly protein PilP [Paracoccus sp. (in: a-proteobacteria)]
ATATVKEGIQVNRTQIIGTIGAGKASRALIRLSNGRVLTLRLGDRINGGTITEIGNSRITFVKGGRAQQLAVLNGQ